MVELIIVILVVGILALIALPKVTHHDRIVELAEQIANDIRYTQMLAMRNDVDYGLISNIVPKIEREYHRISLLWTIVFFDEIESEEDYSGGGRFDSFNGGGGSSFKYGILRHTDVAMFNSSGDLYLHKKRYGHGGMTDERIFARGANNELLGCWDERDKYSIKRGAKLCNKKYYIKFEDNIKITYSYVGCILPPPHHPGLPYGPFQKYPCPNSPLGAPQCFSMGISFDNMGSPHIPNAYMMGGYNEYSFYGTTMYGFYKRKYKPNQRCEIILRSKKKKAVIGIEPETGYVSVTYSDR